MWRKMASSKEAFAKFGTWKKLRTVLKLTILTKGGMPNIFRGEISWFDAERKVVTFVESASRGILPVDLSGASFRVGKRMVEARRGKEDLLVFEEE
jgi:hypothetical protein